MKPGDKKNLQWPVMYVHSGQPGVSPKKFMAMPSLEIRPSLLLPSLLLLSLLLPSLLPTYLFLVSSASGLSSFSFSAFVCFVCFQFLCFCLLWLWLSAFAFHSSGFSTFAFSSSGFSASTFSAFGCLLCRTTGFLEECGEISNQRKNQATTYFRNFFTEHLTDKEFYRAAVSKAGFGHQDF